MGMRDKLRDLLNRSTKAPDSSGPALADTPARSGRCPGPREHSTRERTDTNGARVGSPSLAVAHPSGPTARTPTAWSRWLNSPAPQLRTRPTTFE